MDKRTFLKMAALAGVAGFIDPTRLLASNTTAATPHHIPSPNAAFTLPSLPYSYDALEPHIDKQTMEIHHGRHHQTYVNKLNEAIKGTAYEKQSLEQILRNVKDTEAAVRNNAGGHYNHSFFWTQLAPKAGGQPDGVLIERIDEKFGSFEKFKELFTKEALNRFGSGWAWLNYQRKKGLFVESTPNQDNPLMTGIYKKSKDVVPLLALDVWEHAYYLKYQNKRADYVAAFWNLVNWDEVEKRYKAVAN